MGISVYSLISAIVCFNASILIIAIFRRNTAFLEKNGIVLLLLLTSLSMIRLFFPLDFTFAFVIVSYRILPSILVWISSTRINVFLGIVWGVGSILYLLKSLIIYREERKKLMNYCCISDEQVERVARNLSLDKAKIMVSPEVDVPKVTGYFRAYIYLPQLAVTDEELIFILRHEYQHFKNHDLFIKVFYQLLTAVFWWNPILHLFQRELENLLELRCDDSISRKLNTQERICYLEAILHAAMQLNGTKQRVTIHTAALIKQETIGFIGQRFRFILSMGTPKKRIDTVLSIVAVILIFVFSYIVILQPAYDPPFDNSGETMLVTAQNAYIQQDESGTLELFINGESYGTISKEELADQPYTSLKIIQK